MSVDHEQLLQDKYRILISKVKEDIQSISSSIQSLEGEKTKIRNKICNSEKMLEDEKENDTTEGYEHLLQKFQQEKRLLAEMNRLLNKFEHSKKRLLKLKKDIRHRVTEQVVKCSLTDILKKES
ncbi:unnamed protein product [Allacma fusca]|uniref:Uncharacterized protein n=1 Tax=Allacma fusca TaxID=39272 RepID=A0A8J2K5P8_9HEXA|nr:unnamed protein product [Allacma fusca]